VLGGTLGDLEGGSLAGQFVAPSLFGCGERLELALQGGDRVLRGGGAFEKPFGAAGTGGLGFERRRLDVEDEEVDGPPAYRDDRTAARLHWTWGIGRDARVSARYERAWIETEPTAPTSVPAELFGEREDSELRLALSRDTVGYCWAPRRGTRVSAVGTLVGGPLGGGTDLLAGEVEALAFLPHTRVTTLALRLSVGAFGAFGDDPVPYDRRYALGGPAEMRGYRPRSVGPRTAAGEVVGGDKKLLLNVEYALDAGDRVQAAVFFDAGNAFAEEEALDPLRLRTSVGTELRVRVPVLEIPLRLILALRLPVDTLEQSGTFTVALGTSLGR
jgi:outer membrane protein assembly factor BamA